MGFLIKTEYTRLIPLMLYDPPYNKLNTIMIYAVASKSSQNSLVQFTRIATVNKEMCTNILRCPRDVVRRKCPEK